MIFRVPILALLLVAALAALVALWSSGFAVTVLRRWNLSDTGPAQLRRERMTELVSTLFGAVMIAELAALLLFVFNADRMAALFVGAMCAVGTLGVNPYGFPALYLKIAVFFAAVLWLVLDRADKMARDYPLTKVKYGAILGIAVLVLADGATELTYFLNLKTDVITSCCSKLFVPANEGLSDELASVSPAMALVLLAGTGVLVALSGALSLWSGRFHAVFAVLSAVMFGVGLMAVISVISSYVYEHPNHHCPFCILKPEYGYFGYALYVPLFLGTASGLGAGMLSFFARIPSLQAPLPRLLRSMTWLALGGFAGFGLACLYAILRSNLILFG
ncbi:hypothetical protein RYZ20_03500 [Thioclava sp. A2]|uniref:hypothetical protein n=1 Tax=Thioclava sp. FCG-A2 TaxID=3080562 RepID=UPI00295367B0|nr:hypothetical protein [Thioclava sp. A2]MDV7269961.1 hypothetical protein [Thioclava sp. A2]